MYWRVLIDGAGYSAGTVLDLADTEAVARVAAQVPLVRVTALPRPEPEPEPAPLPVAPVHGSRPAKRKGVR